MNARYNPLLGFAALCMLLLGAPSATAQLSEKLDLYGDARVRVDVDRSDLMGDTAMFELERNRFRARLRFGFTYKLNNTISFGGRLRTGRSVLSGNTDLSDGFIPKEISVDRVFIRTSWDGGSAWAGKNDMPLWRQNELYWDNDATPEGLAVAHTVEIDTTSGVNLAGGVFLTDASQVPSFLDQEKVVAAQAVLATALDPVKLRIGGSYIGMLYQRPELPVATTPADGHFAIGDVAAGFTLLGRPASIGATFMQNLAEITTDSARGDQKTGYSIQAQLGELRNLGDWMVGLTFAHIEAHAVINRFAQDNWFASRPLINSDFQGVELQAGIGLGRGSTLIASAWLVDGIVASANSGRRFRLDWMARF